MSSEEFFCACLSTSGETLPRDAEQRSHNPGVSNRARLSKPHGSNKPALQLLSNYFMVFTKMTLP